MKRWTLLLAGGVLLLGILGTASTVLRPRASPGPAQHATAEAITPPANEPSSNQGADPTPTYTSAATPSLAAGGHRGEPGLSAAPLPPLDARVADIIDDLERRARSGDVRAACRLASELGRCGSIDRRRALDLGRMFAAAPPRQMSDEMVEVAARQSVALEDDERACAGVSSERTRDAVPWLQRAANGGHPPSRIAFASGSWMIADQSFVANPEVVAAYARDAVRMARESIEGGDPTLANALGLAYAGRWSGTPLDPLVQRDDALAYALLAAARGSAPAPPMPVSRRIPGDPGQTAIADLEANMAPADHQRAQAERSRLAARFAAGAEQRRKAGSTTPSWFGTHFAIAPHDCER